MIESHIFSLVLRDLAQFDEVRGGKFSDVFVFGFENKAGRGVVSVRVNLFDVSLSKESEIKVMSVLKNFLFSSLSFKLIEFEVVASMMFAAFKFVVLRDLVMKVSLCFIERGTNAGR